MQIEKVEVNSDGDLVVASLIDDAIYIPGSQTMEDPPEYASALCELTISKQEAIDSFYETTGTEISDLNILDEETLKEIAKEFIDWKYKWIPVEN
jgi:hypothetical protein